MPGVYVGEPIYAAPNRPQVLYHPGTMKVYEPGDRIDLEFDMWMLSSMLRSGAATHEKPLSTRAPGPSARRRRDG